MKKPFDIKEASYELYKIFWIREHIYPEAQEISYARYEKYIKDCAQEKVQSMPYIDFLSEFGYIEGTIYVSYEEFLENEYKDKETMMEILEDDEILIAEYIEDRGYELEEDEYDV